MSTLFALNGKTRDEVKIEILGYEPNKQGVKGIPVKLRIGVDPSMPCTLYFNTLPTGKVIAELRGPIPRTHDDGRPILTIKDGREYYDFVSYQNEAGKTVWAEAPLGSFSVMTSKEKGTKYIMGKMYVSHVHLDMARLLHAIKHPTTMPKEQAIEQLNAIQQKRENAFLVNVFPSKGNVPPERSVEHLTKLFNEEITAPSKAPSPAPSNGPQP